MNAQESYCDLDGIFRMEFRACNITFIDLDEIKTNEYLFAKYLNANIPPRARMATPSVIRSIPESSPTKPSCFKCLEIPEEYIRIWNIGSTFMKYHAKSIRSQ